MIHDFLWEGLKAHYTELGFKVKETRNLRSYFGQALVISLF